MPRSSLPSFTLIVFACVACSSTGEDAAPGAQTMPAATSVAGSGSTPAVESTPKPASSTVPPASTPEQKPAEPAPATPAPGMQTNTPAPMNQGMGTMPSVPAAPSVSDLSAWQPLVDGAWELKGGEEGYRCARLTAKEDLYIKEFQPIAPLGTHHTLLSVNEMPTAPDGIAVCSAADNGHTTLLGSGVGENYSSGPLPEGVAYKIPKGAQLNLNLHLFNVKDDVLKGVSGVKVRTTTADKVKEFAQVTLAGTVMLSIPQGKSMAKGKCTLKSDTTVFAVSPHMHQLGKHLKAVVNRAGGTPVMLYDGPFDFNEQRQFPANMLALKAGDSVDVECTFENTTDRMVKFGESSLDEMCFIGLYRFPLTNDSLVCVR